MSSKCELSGREKLPLTFLFTKVQTKAFVNIAALSRLTKFHFQKLDDIIQTTLSFTFNPANGVVLPRLPHYRVLLEKDLLTYLIV